MARLYPIVDLPHPHALGPSAQLDAIVAGASADAIAMVQLRGKGLGSAALREAAIELGAACRRVGLPLVVNDDVELALSGIDGVVGVHLGQGDAGHDDVAALRRRARDRGVSGFRVGVSTHDLQQLRAAMTQSPDYVGYGPVARTRSKANPDPVVGFDGLADACRVARVPVVAIGGLDPTGAARAVEVGAAMVAVIGGLVAATSEATASAAAEYADAIARGSRLLTVDEVHARIPVLTAETLEQIGRWSNDLSVLAGLRLPARFAPPLVDGRVHYRPSDLCDLLSALGKQHDETWDQWHARGDAEHAQQTLVRLRTPVAAESTRDPEREGG